MKVNGEAIYGTTAGPYPYLHDWGRITQKGNKLYLMFLRWPRGEFILHGLRNNLRGAYLLARPRKKIEISQTHDRKLDHHVLKLSLPPRAPDQHVSGVVLVLSGKADVDQRLIQQGGGAIRLQSHLAELHCPDQDRPFHLSRGGLVDHWVSTKNWLSWDFEVFDPGVFRVEIVQACPKDKTPAVGHTVKIALGGATLEGTTTAEKVVKDPTTRYHPEMATTLGKLRIDHPGTHRLSLHLLKVPEGQDAGLKLTCVNLIPTR